MMKKYFFLFLFLCSTLSSAQTAGILPRDSNFGNSSWYDSTRIIGRLDMKIDEKTKVIHFIRDNNDPRVISKTYVIRNVDAYDFRDYLRQMVQAKRVGNTSLQQVYPGNTASQPYTATVSSAQPVSPGTAQPTCTPVLQLGSNTAVECFKFVDGTGLLIISAEAYRFQDQKGGMGLDSLVEFLDKPGMGGGLGTQTFFYIPKFVPARNLVSLIQNVGMNVTDASELWQGMDLVVNDSELKWLVFDTTNYSMFNIEKMLRLYDVPVPQVRLRITLYELYDENDSRIGIDFQAWKNNEGFDFFSAGGRYRDNWLASYNPGGFQMTGSERTSFYNFNPKWNSRYLDLMQSIGKAKILHTGEVLLRNNAPASIDMRTMIFYMDTSADGPGTSTVPDMAVNAYKLLSAALQRYLAESEDYPVAKGKQQKVVPGTASFGVQMTVENASVNLLETRFRTTLSNSSLIGFDSSGKPRISNSSTVSLDVSLPHGTNSFVIGGLRKEEKVRSKTGVPYLMDIPYLGYLFSSVSDSVKHSELLIVGECSFDSPADAPSVPARSKSRRKK